MNSLLLKTYVYFISCSAVKADDFFPSILHDEKRKRLNYYKEPIKPVLLGLLPLALAPLKNKNNTVLRMAKDESSEDKETVTDPFLTFAQTF